MRPASLAVDIGGTKIAYGIVPDDAPGTVLGEGRVPSLAREGRTLDQLAVAVERALDTPGVDIVRAGVGCPGVVRDGEITYNGDTVPGWAGSDVAGTVERLAGVPVACHNDVRVWAFGEHRLGAGQGTSGRVYYLSLGTGVGGAIVDTHGLLPGPTGSAGESANLVCADLDGRAVRCEDAVSGPGLARYYNERAGADLTLPEIIGRHDAAAVIDSNLSGFGYAVGALVTLLDLSAVVLGGGVGSLGEIIREPFARGLRAGTLAIQADVPVLTTTLGPAAPLIAAAEYARAEGA